MSAWEVIDGPYFCQPEADAIMEWEWSLERGGERRSVRVAISTDTVGAESVAEESWLAASLRGRPAFDPYLEQDAPPSRFLICTDGVEVVG